MITIFTGPVKSGKTDKLIDLIKETPKSMAFKAKFSLQNDDCKDVKFVPINSLHDIKYHINHCVENIFINDFQFLQMTIEELAYFFDKYYDKYNFYIFGLNLDYNRTPYKLFSFMMAMADKIEFMDAKCYYCGKPAKYSTLMLESNYEPVCRNCWVEESEGL